MAQQQYMSVGELARRVGVSVRTIQYYDQKGLLHPSSIGSAGQRLYSEDDETELRHILVLKYLGMSLSDVRDNLDQTRDPETVHQLIADQRKKLDEQLLKFFERRTVLRELDEAVSEAEDDDAPLDWRSLAGTVENSQRDKRSFWQTLASDGSGERGGMSREDVLAWHSLMGETIEAMQNNEPVDSDHARDLARRFMAMGGMKMAMAGLGRMGGKPGRPNPKGAGTRGRDFYRLLQDRTLGYLQEAAKKLE
jgi:DNA-binding transcriptional MerR regulator